MLYAIYYRTYLLGHIRAQSCKDAITSWGVPIEDDAADYTARGIA